MHSRSQSDHKRHYCTLLRNGSVVISGSGPQASCFVDLGCLRRPRPAVTRLLFVGGYRSAQLLSSSSPVLLFLLLGVLLLLLLFLLLGASKTCVLRRVSGDLRSAAFAASAVAAADAAPGDYVIFGHVDDGRGRKRTTTKTTTQLRWRRREGVEKQRQGRGRRLANIDLRRDWKGGDC